MIRAELNQSRLRGGQRLPIFFVQKVLSACSKELQEKKRKYISIAFVSEKEIRALNKAYRGKNSVTDILSFPIDDDSSLLGELIICYEQAVRQAREMNHSVRSELGFLIVHGVLHLYGYDHERPSDAKKMFCLQEHILYSLGIDSKL
jgi:probable rRNA maturation factor